MAWSWTRSGRVDAFEYEMIPVKSVNSKPSGKLAGVTGGQLNFDHDGSEKVSGSLDVVRTQFVNNCYVRVWYRPALSGEGSKRIELATCFASTEKGHYEDGVYSGKVELHGVLTRFTADKLHRDYTIPKGSSALDYFRKMFAWLGGQYAIKGVRDRKVSRNRVFERGKAPMEVLQWIADYLGAEVTCDTHGRVVLQRYVAPGKKPVSYTIPTGADSVTLPGVDITSTQAGTVNRASVRHEWTEKVQVPDGTYKYDYTDSKGVKHAKGSAKFKTESRKRSLLGVAVAAASSKVSRQKAGRWVTEVYDLDAMSPLTQARIDAIARSKLKRASGTTVRYGFDTLSYLPVSTGQVVRFRYDKLRVVGIVKSIDLSLEPGCPMRVEIRKVRNG